MVCNGWLDAFNTSIFARTEFPALEQNRFVATAERSRIAGTIKQFLVVALPDESLARQVQDLLHTRTFRVYMGTDVVGCEIAGATKNVMAIAAGICDGLGFGENTRAVLITRGLAELGRLGVSLGGQVLTVREQCSNRDAMAAPGRRGNR